MQCFPKAAHPYIYLARYDRPSAIWILFIPCLLGFALVGMENVSRETIFLFFCGSILMRGAGCVLNDMADQQIDRGVARTRGRPLAKGDINNVQALGFLAVNLALAQWILQQFDGRTILVGCAFVPLVILYPFMKRWTYWPQLFLGLTFNGGILVAWSATGRDFSWEIGMLYLAAILWTVGYDTIYGYQDLEDDLLVGVRSPAVKCQGQIHGFLRVCFLGMVGVLGLLGTMAHLKWKYYVGLGILFFTFMWQLSRVKKGNKKTYLYVFKEQKYIGFLVLLSLILGKFKEEMIMAKYTWLPLLAVFFLISACGKKGDLVYEGNSQFPRTYPSASQ